MDAAVSRDTRVSRWMKNHDCHNQPTMEGATELLLPTSDVGIPTRCHVRFMHLISNPTSIFFGHPFSSLPLSIGYVVDTEHRPPAPGAPYTPPA